MTRIVALIVAVLPAVTFADSKLYPERIDIDISCNLAANVIEAIEARYTDPDVGQEGIARATAVDLNQDGNCEVLLDMPIMYEGNGNAFTLVLMDRNGEFVDSGEIQWMPDTWWYGEFLNGYARIFVPTYMGHRTNPQFITAVYAFDGKKYVVEPSPANTHGYFLDEGLRAYRAGNFATAEIHYENAYRMRKEPGLAEANNLALTWLRLGKLDKAKALLESHLSGSSSSDQEAAAYFNLCLIAERVGDIVSALRNCERATEISPTPARLKKVRELASLTSSPR